jgi:hypothetical protein
MKLSLLTRFIAPAALLALASFDASAATCNASYTMLAVSQTGFSCTMGDVTFSNFLYNFTAGIDTGAPQNLGSPGTPTPATQVNVNFSMFTDGTADSFGTVSSATNALFEVVVNYTGNNTVNEFQNEHYFMSYLVTAGHTMNQVDDSVTGASTNGLGASAGLSDKDICVGGVFTPVGGNQPNNRCSQGSRNLYQAVSDLGLAVTGSSNKQADSSASYSAQNDGMFTGGSSTGGTVLGIYDQSDMDGGASDVNSSASITQTENDFVEQLPAVITPSPEPGTFVLLGAALVGVGGLRRRKKAA